ncbi:hypothetical protein G4V62_11620 [Bacillaceae bacterium SIJ1]|uniref:polysaccharide lyase family 8 super-sandwich domain-containing protein n=1 Tax=Litoribacterium kuwaitense TaxID=1398745 RepID=UPI0013EBFB54|nr:polysaccharide lyase family 8 super-sandwich domain-containing protein [Litoribacterium kuwaitense]NGP45570.1 hypothetical protein [Litoribacterium kuwaitense]
MKKHWMFIALSVLLLWSVVSVSNAGHASAEEDIRVMNNSFEEVEPQTGEWDGEVPQDWMVWKPTGDPAVFVTDEQAYTGSHALEISALEEGRAAVSQDVDVSGGATYLFSAWIKTEDVTSTQGARLRATYYSGGEQQELIYSAKVSGTKDWTYIEKVLTPPEHVDRIRVQNFLEKGTGTAWFDEVNLTKIIPLEAVEIVQEDMTVRAGETVSLQWSITPENATHQEVSWVSSSEDVATVDNGVVTARKQGTAIISVISQQGSLSDDVVVTVEEDPNDELTPIDSITLPTELLTMREGQHRLLEPTVTPAEATEELVWRSSHPDIASVSGGVVTAVASGETTISVMAEDGRVQAERDIQVAAYEPDRFDALREKWNERLLGRDAFDPNHPRMVDILTNKTENAETLWQTMNRNDVRDYLWLDLSSTTNPKDITESYRNLHRMAEMFVTERSSLYHDPELLTDLISGLNWMYEQRYNEHIAQYGNWWHWEIGAPKSLNDLVSLLYPYLEEEAVHRYLTAVDHFQPDPTKSGATTPDRYREAYGANRIDTSKVVAIRGLLVKDADKLAASRDALSQVFEYVDVGNGFYEDGSFIQHEDIPYTGSYGLVLIEGLEGLLQLFSDSDWEVVDPEVAHVYKWMTESFEPLIYKGSLMDMVRGRAISRSSLQDQQAGYSVTRTILRMSTFAPEPYATTYEQMAKYWIQQSGEAAYLQHTSRFNDIVLTTDLLEDDSITPRGELLGHFTFANMDRVVTRKPGYTFGISMYSDRTQNYEDMNDENRKGWYTSAGMTYLYNGGQSQYSDGFWPTIDPYRMPGTTVDTMARSDGSGEHRSPHAWAGGSTLADMFGTAGMEYSGWESSLTAKKSWFMFDDEIVALGAGITSDEERNVETIVENRQIKRDGSNHLSVNGEVQAGTAFETVQDNVSYAFLAGADDGGNIGYYFPEGVQLHLKKEQREGAWQDINYTQPGDLLTRSYATMWIDHDVKPSDDQYAYVLLPNRSEQEVADYAANPDIEVLRNDSAVQAVRDQELGVVGANFWNDEKQTVGSLTAYDQASVTMKKTPNTIELAVADPTMNNDGFIELEISEKVFDVIAADERVEVVQTKPFVRLQVDVSDAKGSSVAVTLSTDANATKHASLFTVSSEVGGGQWQAGEAMTADISVTSEKNAQPATLTFAYYDWKGQLQKQVNKDIQLKKGDSKSYDLSLTLPNEVIGGTLRIFVWKGKDIGGNGYKRLSNVVIHESDN